MIVLLVLVLSAALCCVSTNDPGAFNDARLGFRLCHALGCRGGDNLEQPRGPRVQRLPLLPVIRVPIVHRAILAEIKLLGLSPTWVFPNPTRSGPMDTTQKAAERIRTRTGIDFRQHDLRRTAASHMTGMGVSRLVVGKILNHVEAGVTADLAAQRHAVRHPVLRDFGWDRPPGRREVDVAPRIPRISPPRCAVSRRSL